MLRDRFKATKTCTALDKTQEIPCFPAVGLKPAESGYCSFMSMFKDLQKINPELDVEDEEVPCAFKFQGQDKL